eukprot:gene4346-5945_t
MASSSMSQPPLVKINRVEKRFGSGPLLNEDLLAIRARDPFTGFFVTHSVTEAVYLSTRIVVLSANPGRIAQVIDVPFGYPRPAELRETPEFLQLLATTSRALRAPAITGVGLIALWYLIKKVTGMPSFVLPAPHEILEAGWNERSVLFGAVMLTARGAVLGFLAAVGVGFLLSMALGFSPRIKASFYPYIL